MWAIVGFIFVHKLQISAIPLAICVFIHISLYKNKFIKYQEHVLFANIVSDRWSMQHFMKISSF